MFAPELAIANTPGLKAMLKFSSGKVCPKIETPPVPSALVKSPP